MRRILIILIFTLFGCTRSNFQRTPTSTDFQTASCHEIVKSFDSITELTFLAKMHDMYKYNDPLTFSREEQLLEMKIRYWAKLGDREFTLEQLRHNEAFAHIKSLFNIDSRFAIVRQTRPIFYETELSYFVSKRALSRIKILEKLNKSLSETGTLSQELKDIVLNDYLKNPLLKTEITPKDLDNIWVTSLRKKINKDLARHNETLIEYSTRLANKYDSYVVMRKYIELIAGSPGPRQADAKDVLKKLDTKSILDSCRACGDPTKLSRPRLNDIQAYAQGLRVTRIMYLKQQLMFERILTLVGMTPSNIMMSSFDKVLQRVPWLNQADIRKWVRRTFLDGHDVLKFFPNIDRVVFSDGQTKDLVDLVNDFAVRKDGDNFLTTFARRLDAQDEYLKLYNWLKDNAPADELHHYQILFKKMTKAREEAAKRGFLPEWHVPKAIGSNRIILETVFMAAGAYVSYYYFDINYKGVKETVNDAAGQDILKQEEFIDTLNEELDSNENIQNVEDEQKL